MRVALIGCGYVADYYVRSFAAHPALEIVGVADRDASRLEQFSRFHGLRAYPTAGDALADNDVDIVINLTNPTSHYELSRNALLAGKHVYTEKPIAMEFSQAAELVALAEQQGKLICSAPCSVLGETAQTMWKALREERIGTVRLVYAELDDGFVPRMRYQSWLSESGAPWPYHDEFQVGCTLEHAGYCLTWLVAFFGHAHSVTAFSSCVVPDKLSDELKFDCAPDFSVACITFASGVVARLTCSIVAPHDHSLTVIGDAGTLSTKETWDFRSPVYLRKSFSLRRRTMLSPIPLRCRLLESGGRRVRTQGSQRMDFARGVAEMAGAIREERTCRLSPQFSLHVNELALAIHNASATNNSTKLTTSFEPMKPMPWAR